MNKKTLFFTPLSFLIIPMTALAQAAPGPIEKIAGNVANVVIYVAGGIVVIIWAITGILFLSSQGSPEKMGTAKKSLFAAITGTVLVILAVSAKAIIENVILRGV
ncbi:MAG: hypothetical protein HY005_03345 [Candidatus Staskawiczbacteria bacterium]|nr:hypothetical protein [Candidatus Staskawiczbacteria bacterium]